MDELSQRKFKSKNTKIFTTELSEIKENGLIKNNFGKNFQGNKINSDRRKIQEIALNTNDSLNAYVSDKYSSGSYINLYINTLHGDKKKVDYSKYVYLDPNKKQRSYKSIQLPRIVIKEMDKDVLPEKVDIYKKLKIKDILGLSKINKPVFKY